MRRRRKKVINEVDAGRDRATPASVDDDEPLTFVSPCFLYARREGGREGGWEAGRDGGREGGRERTLKSRLL